MSSAEATTTGVNEAFPDHDAAAYGLTSRHSKRRRVQSASKLPTCWLGGVDPKFHEGEITKKNKEIESLEVANAVLSEQLAKARAEFDQASGTKNALLKTREDTGRLLARALDKKTFNPSNVIAMARAVVSLLEQRQEKTQKLEEEKFYRH